MSRFWHGFADMHTVTDNEVVIVAGDGAMITDSKGNDYIDSTAALWFCNVGYGRREIADAVADQLTRLSAYSSFGPYTTDATIRLADRLADLSPLEETVVYLGSGASDGIDTAIKLARRYWDVIGRPEKSLIVAREHSYHGMHAVGTSLSPIPALRNGYGVACAGDVLSLPTLDLAATTRPFAASACPMPAFIGA